MMSIIHKLKTAKHELREHGIHEVISLLKKNLFRIFVHRYRKFYSKAYRKLYSWIFRHFPRNKKMHILYITSELEAEFAQTVRYRIWNPMEALKHRAKTRFEILENGIFRDRCFLAWADIIILMRVGNNEKVQSVVKLARAADVPLVYDIDDIIFLPEYLNNFCQVIQEDKPEMIDYYRKEHESFHEAFLSCDYATASTPFIAEKMEAEGRQAFVIHNGLNKAQLRIAGRVKKPKGAVRYVGYLSGSNTHNIDFLQAAKALDRIVKENSDVKFRVVGYLDEGAMTSDLAKNTEIACFMPWKKLMARSASNYLNIAPLDIANPFCHAKSELKFYEAAILGIPTVASPTDTFKRCIENGVNGMLATDSTEWYNALSMLLNNQELYDQVVESGRAYAFSHYSPEAIADEAMSAYEKIISGCAQKRKQGSK